MYSLYKPLVFMLSPESAHHLTITMLKIAGNLAPTRALIKALYFPKMNGPAVDVMGLHFANPIGMAAGYDKDGDGWRGLSALGFGHIELGTVTVDPQSGNAKPRIFRIPEERAVINRCGFPNLGADYMLQRMNGHKPKDLILGVSIGKNKNVPLERAEEDYVQLMELFAEKSDYLAVNVSSPNTPGLRELQVKGRFDRLLRAVAEKRAALVSKFGKKVPVVVKLAPELQENEMDECLSVIMDTGLDGVIISNTSLDRHGLKSALGETEYGGLSGAPIMKHSTELIKTVMKRTEGKLPIIASGGVMNVHDAQEKLDAGAKLVQLYTGMIFEGPEMPGKIIHSGLRL
ncbi:MAG: quinone-dependent dihydroorotate dehydrogenase [Anaerolineaceae bacterium]|nr:quinone-dependent dihydroorotate dehydrogenase [Anaerolineaceae bacterium]